MPQQRYYLAIDIGASSGRHVLGSVNGNGVIELEEVHRFDNVQVRRRGHDCWDIDMIWENILVGLEKCRKAGKIPETIGIDTWGVDFVLVDAQGRLVGDAVAYRDARTNDVAADVVCVGVIAVSAVAPEIIPSFYRSCCLKKFGCA